MPEIIVYKLGVMRLAAEKSWDPKIETYLDWFLEKNPRELDGLLLGMKHFPQASNIKRYIQKKSG